MRVRHKYIVSRYVFGCEFGWIGGRGISDTRFRTRRCPISLCGKDFREVAKDASGYMPGWVTDLARGTRSIYTDCGMPVCQ